MEVRLSHCRDFYLQNPTSSTTTLFKSRSFCLKSWFNSNRSFKNNFRGLTLKWRIQLEEVLKGQHSTKSSFTHVVKEGETLTSISKLYGMSIYSIAAANKDIVDVDLVFEGQQLRIPTSSGGDIPMFFVMGFICFQLVLACNAAHLWGCNRCCTKKNSIPSSDLRERKHGLRDVLEGFSSEKIFNMQAFHHLPHAKTTGYFLVLVPLIAFCIKCIIGAFHTEVVRKTGLRGMNESKGRPFVSKTKNQRWKCALSDIREPDNLQSASVPDSASSEDDAQVSSEELSLAYKRLEHDYQKFLSQCGMSRWGYWRGGSPD